MGNEVKDVSCGIVNKDDKILMVKRCKKEKDLLWVFPGGKIEDGETSEQACVREVFEETGVNVSIIGLLGERVHPNTGVKIYYYLCQYESGEIRILDENEILEVAFKTKEEILNDVKTDIFQPVKEYILRKIK